MGRRRDTPRPAREGWHAIASAICILALAAAALYPAGAAGAVTVATSLKAGADDYCATTATGGLECWGWNYYGQLGVGTDTGPQICGWGSETYPIGCSTVPVTVDGLGSGVRTAALGYAHACSLTDAGGVSCWGDNRDGRLGDGTKTGPEMCGEFPGACSKVPVPVSGLGSGVSAISAAWEQSCAVTGSGGVECWGANYDGELGDGTTTPSTTPVAVQMPLGATATAIASGGYHTCALTGAGSVLCWGYDDFGELGDGTDTGPQNCEEGGEDPCSTTPVAVQLPVGTTATAIASGGYFSCALTGAGGVLCWGRDVGGELGDGENTVDSTTPVAVRLPGGVKATAISAGTFHACAVTSAGLYCWGRNLTAQLGDGEESGPELCEPGEYPCATVPIPVRGLGEEVTAVAGGEESTCALTAIGGAWCWGFSRNGGLGAGNLAFSLTPVQVSGLPGARRLSVSVEGAGSGEVSSSPGGVDCGAGHGFCTELFAAGSTASLRATPAPGSAFLGFTGLGCVGAGPTCEVSMGADRSVTARFGGVPSVRIIAPTDDGTYALGQSVATSFACVEGAEGPGLASCDDSDGTDSASGGTGHLDTSTPGRRTYTVTAVSEDGASEAASLTYTVLAPPASSTPESAPHGSPGPDEPPVPALKVRIRGGLAPVADRATKARLECEGGTPGSSCRGVVSLASPGRVLGRAGYALPAGATELVSVGLKGAALALLAQAPHDRLRVDVTAGVGGSRGAHRAMILTLGRNRRSRTG